MKKIVTESLAGALMLSVFLYVGFMALEPTIIRAQAASSQFTIKQTISSEVTFSTAPTNVILSPSIGALTGGTSDGGTQVVVRTNDPLGYTMTLTASSSLGMINDTAPSQAIPYLTPGTTGTPDYSFDSTTVGANLIRFAYTVEASTTADTSAAFKDNGSTTCNTGSNNTADKCWLNASTSAVTIINRTSSTTASGATTTIKFRVVAKPNVSQALDAGTYTATTTLTATGN